MVKLDWQEFLVSVEILINREYGKIVEFAHSAN